jgi:EAL domain-containing protein (putative c-di-GMP-specific phosphodiesterase class I)
VHGVTDSRLAVERCLELRPDVVLLDLRMPHLDGVAVLHALRAAVPATDFLPVVVLTADISRAVRKEALDAGASDFVTKPFDGIEVVQRVRNLLSMRAMYREVQRHNAELEAELERQAEEQRRIAVAAEKRRARVAGAFVEGAMRIVFQPVVDLVSGRTVAVEALARFDCEPQGTPDLWFAEAAVAGRGVELEVMAIDNAVAMFDQLPPDAVLSLNASPMTVVSGALEGALERLPGPRVILELTEHDRVEDYDVVLASLEGLRQQGVRIAVDDAGAGYAGLQQILRLRPDIIKLDLDITRGIDRDPVRRALASSLLTFGHDTGALIAAEGIETYAELETMRDLGVRWGQGFFLARPGELPVPAFVAVGQLRTERQRGGDAPS